jgi:hypothetical protein
MFATLKSNNKSPLGTDWLGMLEFFRGNTMLHIDNIVEKTAYLDAELVNCISLIQSCEYFIILGFVIHQRNCGEFKEQSLEFLGQLFFQYGVYCAYLDAYAKKHFKGQNNWSRYGVASAQFQQH